MKGPSHDANKRRLALITFLLSNQLAFGLVNLAAITITPPATRTPSTSPWIAARRRRARTPLFNAPTDATTAVEGSSSSSSSSTTTSPDESPPLSLSLSSSSSSSQRDDAVVQQQSPPNQKVGTTNSNNNGVVVLPRKGVWMPPSQNVAQRRGKIFSIEQPQDLLDFVIEDERLSVVKVYASWCKTCKVFDVRYRKLASQYGDEYDDDTDKSGTTQRVERKGRVRFAEMRYDNPNNEEMCKLLNATKLPYILMYKGSKGKVKEFQCGPAKVQLLIDAVNELADPVVVEESDVGTNGDEVSESSKPFDGGDLAASPLNDDNLTKTSNGEDNTIKDLRQKLIALENEKVEMFEIMKAQIEHDKEYIQKLESGVETQKHMIETKDGEISGLKTSIEKERSTIKSLESGVETTQTSMLETKDGEISSLKNSIEQEQSMAKSQREKIEQAEEELASFQSQVSELTDRLSQIEETATSLDLELSLNKKAAEKKEKGFLQQREEWEGHKEMYEKDRNSLRRLAVLGVKRVGRGARSLFFGVRRK